MKKIDIKIPHLGEGVTQIELFDWHVQNGQYINKDDEVAEVSTSKSTIVIESPQAGTIEILKEVGSTVKEDDIIACVKYQDSQIFEQSDRLKNLPPYLFTIVDQIKTEVLQKGRDVIDLSMGNPDGATPEHIVEALCMSVKNKENHRYSKSNEECESEFREAIAMWYKKRFDVDLDPNHEVLPLIGSKEGIANLCMALLGPGDDVLLPMPSYPIHINGPIIAGATPHLLPINEENGFFPQYKKLDKAFLEKAKMFIFSYPNNPTGAVANLSQFQKLYDDFRGGKTLLVHDAAYTELTMEGIKAPSFLQVQGAKEIAIEFHTLSKSLNMAGWRVGFVVGNSSVINSLAKAKSYTDFGIFRGVQKAAIEALCSPLSDQYIQKIRYQYNERLKFFVKGLNQIGWPTRCPEGTMYIWTILPKVYQSWGSIEFVSRLLRKTGVACSPGIGFGKQAEGFIRFSVVQSRPQLEEALKRIQAFFKEESK